MHSHRALHALALVAAIVVPGCSCEPEPLHGDDGGDAAPLPIGGVDDDGGSAALDGGADPEPTAPAACVRVLVGDDVPQALVVEIVRLLDAATDAPVVVRVGTATTCVDDGVACSVDCDDTFVLALGDVPENPVDAATRATLAPEAYAVARSTTADGAPIVGVFGAPGSDGTKRSPGGAAFGAMAVLEDLGFAFLHPLAPHAPTTLDPAGVVARTSTPRWPVRNIHLHTSHPVELHEVLNGFGPGGVDDAAGFEADRARFRSFLVWLVAGGGNEAQWLLLEAESWSDFAVSDLRRARLASLVDDCRAFGVSCGITVPIVQHQQHSFRLITDIGDPVAEEQQLRERLTWVLGAGFDFLATSSGTTEFTHPTAERMLAWMDLVTRVAADDHGVETRMNIHVSPGQVAEPFVDQDTGAPLNFNFLPTLADPRLAVQPHTVQIYGLDDPAPTYGNTDFFFMREFLQQEVGRRRVIFHPETAYWVSVDVDVPLFLPVYAERRVADLQLLADDEDMGLMGRGAHAGGKMQGQNIFTSGWEWGYWLNDLVALRASWDPFRGAATSGEATARILAPLARALGDDGDVVVDAIIGLAFDQRELLVYGRVDGVDPPTMDRRTGLAYLAGSEAFDDIAVLADRVGVAGPKTQPFRLGLVEMRAILRPPPRYTGEVDPLLAAMETAFTARAAVVDAALAGRTDPVARELVDAFAITRLRAQQVHALYDSVDERASSLGPIRLADARAALDEATVVVADREASYRMPAARIAAWRENPTAYRFTYLWTAHSLWYWWRDEHQAAAAPASPCVMNIIDPADVALGEGTAQTGLEVLSALATGGFADVAACSSAPVAEPVPPPRPLSAP